jgi:NADP-dependent 3-hydroxy acid dehydrogenase YdfG
MQLRETGLLVNILSDAARRPFAGGTAYCASKFAQDGFFGSLRHELASTAIRICNVYPGLVNTYFNGKTPTAPQAHKLEAWQVAEAVWQIIEDGGEPAELMLLPSN